MFQTATCPSTRHGPPYMRTAPQTHRRTAGLAEQLPLFADNPRFPEGLRYAAEFISPAIERELIAEVASLPLQPFQFGQYEGKRRVASFGFRYDYTLRRLQEADPIPPWLAAADRTRRRVWRPGHQDRARCSVPNTTPASASAGTATNRTSTGYSDCRWDRRAGSVFGGPPATNGSALRSMRLRGRST